MSVRHVDLIKKAKEILKNKGFKEDEIHEEFGFKNYRIDVVGWSDENKIAVECGYCDSGKREELEKFFDEVICLLYEGLEPLTSFDMEPVKTSNFPLKKLVGLKLSLMKGNDVLFEIPLSMEDWSEDNLQDELTSFEQEIERFTRLFDALSHQTRLRMMKRLFEDEDLTLGFSDFMKDLTLNPKIVWESTKKLCDEGLLVKSDNGKYQCSELGQAEFLMLSLALRRLLQVLEQMEQL